MSSITRRAKALVHRTANAFGYQIRRLPAGDAFEAQKRLLDGRPVYVILDVGAYVGNVAKRYRTLFPAATIHCFEPYPPSYSELKRLVGTFAEVHNIGVAEESGVRTLHVNRAPYTSSLLKPAIGTDSFVKPSLTESIAEVQVNVVAIDDFCRQNSVDRVQILKIDIQGTELAALRGAQGMLSTRAVDLVYLEVNFAPMYEGQTSLCELEAYMQSFGYRFAGVFDPQLTSSGRLAWADAIFVAPGLSGKPTMDDARPAGPPSPSGFA